MFFLNKLKIKKKFNIEINNENKNIIFCVFDSIIVLKEFVGIKPPAETKLMLKFSELKSLTSETLSNKKIAKLNIEYNMKILVKRSFILFSELTLPSSEYVRSFILKLNFLLENIKIKKNKKYKPPIH